ncbi:MAG: flagellar hook-associated protein FlgK [OCS116 cluster bacterium]|uniref:Flagellar hook-associated protein 1 n=1 Tax=OCS116 cluster bacterium TaxID=2030921 RepID=A0A2A4Z0X2_9PROT|nr:flagellar hook-associated protein FlgK [OCS116 cluster bacterium]
MGLGQSISNALGGLRATQMGIEVAARNVANADTEGYTKKTLALDSNVVGNKGFGVSIGAVTRQIDRFLQARVRTEYSDFNDLNVQTEFLQYIDNLFGKPGADGSLDTIVNSVGSALVGFVNAPQLDASRQELIESSEYLASHLRDISSQVQDMRQNAEHMIAQEVDRANIAMDNIARISHQLTTYPRGDGTADLQDQLDNQIDDLSAILDIKVFADGKNGAVKVFTASGLALVDGTANRLVFDERANITATHLYNEDDDLRRVGTITLETGTDTPIDFIQTGTIKSGKLAGLLKMRDDVLVNAQDQLDELAHGLASVFNTIHTDGTAVTAGANEGFKLDLSGLSDGNIVEFDYKDNATGYSHKISFVKVSDPTLLPLKDSFTANGTDKVFGIDFSGGMASVQAQIAAAITGENPNFNVTLVGGTDIQILDDGGPDLVDVIGVSGQETATGLQGQGTEMNFFKDWDGNSQENYTNNLDGFGQKRGFASRIRLNDALKDDNTLLIKYSTTTSLGDQTRPADLLKKFTETQFSFNANSGIGTQSSPFSGTLGSFTQQVVADQTSRIDRHSRMAENQEMVLSAMNARMESKTKVNVDEEMAQLLVLQTAYAANARIVSVIKELMDTMMRM